MKEYYYLNSSKMLVLAKRLQGAEVKMLFAMMYCMSSAHSMLFINNKENRERMKDIDFAKSPERISLLLSSLTKKGIIKREFNGVYRLPEDLFLLADKSEVK